MPILAATLDPRITRPATPPPGGWSPVVAAALAAERQPAERRPVSAGQGR